jgi:hypothetical protein
MTELEKLFDHAKAHSRQSMEKEGGIFPIFFCHVPGVDGCGVIPCFWNSPIQKLFVVNQVKAKFQELKIDRFAFYGESWITDRTGLAPDEPAPPERLANRKECILVFAEDKSGQSKVGWWPIRESDGNVTLDDFVLQTEALTSTSMTFANMFGVKIFH